MRPPGNHSWVRTCTTSGIAPPPHSVRTLRRLQQPRAGNDARGHSRCMVALPGACVPGASRTFFTVGGAAGSNQQVLCRDIPLRVAVVASGE